MISHAGLRTYLNTPPCVQHVQDAKRKEKKKGIRAKKKLYNAKTGPMGLKQNTTKGLG